MTHPDAPRKFEITCSSCNLHEMCLPGGVCLDELERVEGIVYARRRVKRGEALFKAGDEFHSIYAVRSGFFKTSLIDNDGREQVTGFFMGGELLGMDGVGSGSYNGNAIALEDSEVCVMPFALVEQMSRELPSLQRHLHSVLAREIVRDHGVMMLLGSMRAEERLADLPHQPVAPLRAPRLLVVGLPPAHDARGDRQLSRPQARDGEPAVLPVPEGRR